MREFEDAMRPNTECKTQENPYKTRQASVKQKMKDRWAACEFHS